MCFSHQWWLIIGMRAIDRSMPANGSTHRTDMLIASPSPEPSEAWAADIANNIMNGDSVDIAAAPEAMRGRAGRAPATRGGLLRITCGTGGQPAAVHRGEATGAPPSRAARFSEPREAGCIPWRARSVVLCYGHNLSYYF